MDDLSTRLSDHADLIYRVSAARIPHPIIREVLDALDALTRERDELAHERWGVVAHRNAAIEERDDALAKVERLKGALRAAGVSENLVEEIAEGNE